MTEHEIIADIAICSKCRKPHLLWQSWRELFICGWCKKEYTLQEAKKLKKLSEREYKKIQERRLVIIHNANWKLDYAKS